MLLFLIISAGVSEKRMEGMHSLYYCQSLNEEMICRMLFLRSDSINDRSN